MNITQKILIFVAVVAVAGVVGYGFGRYVQPPKVTEKVVTIEKEVIKVETQIVEKKVYVKVDNVDTKTEIVIIKRPDGTEETKTTIVDKSVIKEQDQNETATTVVDTSEKSETKVLEKVTTVVKDYHVRVDAGAGAKFVGELTPVMQFGVGFERRIVGPIFGGVWVNTTLNLLAPQTPPYTVTGGISVGLEF